MFLFKKILLTALCFFLYTTNALTSELTAEEILEKSIQNSSTITNIYTQFKQEKHLPNFDTPINTSGSLFFEKTKPYSLFWEYSSPYLSGIFYENDKVYVWTKTRKNVRQPQKHEESFTQIMLKQLIFWLNINIENINNNYHIEKINNFSLKLSPKKKDFFTSIELVFEESYKNLKKLTFFEANSASTSLNFINTEFNISKETLFSYEKLFGNDS